MIIATSGWTTRELLVGIQKALPIGTFDVVFLQLGVNNQYHGLPKEQFECELNNLLDQAVEFAGGDSSRVVVLSIPDWHSGWITSSSIQVTVRRWRKRG